MSYELWVMGKKRSIVREKSFSFAIRIVNLYKLLSNERKEFVLSKQLLRSGTSVGANIREAINAESPADFIHKLAVAQKECDETLYWIELIKETDYLKDSEYDSIYKDGEELLKINDYRTRYLNNDKHIPSGMYSSVEIRMFSQPASRRDATFLCWLQTYGLQGKKGRVFAFSTELCISTRCGFMQLGSVSDIHIKIIRSIILTSKTTHNS